MPREVKLTSVSTRCDEASSVFPEYHAGEVNFTLNGFQMTMTRAQYRIQFTLPYNLD